ncbi:MAG: hypothetical protein ISP38_07905 [PS1 clade bacterium]|nr:hypothetical protein [PS1 clade bacterium]
MLPGRRATAASYLGREVRQTLSLSSRLKIGAAKAVTKTIAMTRQRASIGKPHDKKYMIYRFGFVLIIASETGGVLPLAALAENRHSINAPFRFMKAAYARIKA